MVLIPLVGARLIMSNFLLLVMFGVGISVPIMLFRMLVRHWTGDDIVVMDKFVKASKFWGDNNWENQSGERLKRDVTPVHDNTIRYNWHSKPKRRKQKPDPQVADSIRAETRLHEDFSGNKDAIPLSDLVPNDKHQQQS